MAEGAAGGDDGAAGSYDARTEVRTLSADDVASGRYSLDDVLLPVPASAVALPPHETRGALVATLILTAHVQADLGLGKINYLIWQDGYNLLLFAITILALCQTLVVHRILSFWQVGALLTSPLFPQISSTRPSLASPLICPGLLSGTRPPS